MTALYTQLKDGTILTGNSCLANWSGKTLNFCKSNNVCNAPINSLSTILSGATKEKTGVFSSDLNKRHAPRVGKLTLKFSNQSPHNPL